MKSFNPLITVIIPNFNHAKYLRERIDSVLNQTYNNIEVFFLTTALMTIAKKY